MRRPDPLAPFPLREGGTRKGWIAQQAPWAVEPQPFSSDGQDGTLRVRLGDHTLEMELFVDAEGRGWCRHHGRLRPVAVVREGKRVHVWLDGHAFVFELTDAQPRKARGAAGGQEGLSAPVPGKVLLVAVKQGDRVEIGQKLLSIESMKMEFVVRARAAGTVRRVLVADGDQVLAGAPLLEMGE